MIEEQNTEALKKARIFSDNKDKIDGFYNGYVQATIELEKENAEAKKLIELLLSDNRTMEAQFESEEQANIWFEHIRQAEQFLKDLEK